MGRVEHYNHSTNRHATVKCAPVPCDRAVPRRPLLLFMYVPGRAKQKTNGYIFSLTATHDALHTMTAGLPHAAATAAEAASEHETSSTDMTSSGGRLPRRSTS